MGARVRALIGVAVLSTVICAVLSGLPGLSASAAPTPAPTPTRSLTISTFDLSPFVITDADGIKSGFTIDILDAVAKREGWTLRYLDVDNVTAQLRAVGDGQADAAAGAISITADRTQRFDFSQPILNAGLQIMVPVGTNQRSNPGLADFLKLLFSKSMLIWLAAALALTVIPAHIIWLVERRHNDGMVARSYFPGIFQAFSWGLGMLAAAPDDSPRHWGTRGLAVLWAFVSIIFVAYYTATLTANLTVEKFDAQISTPSDLVGKRVCTVANTTSTAFLQTAGIQATGAPKISDCYAGLQSGDFDATVFDAPVLRYYAAQDGAGKVQMAGPIFQNEDYGVAFRNGSDLRKQLDETLLSLREDGTYDLIKGKWFGTEAPDS
jgi:polar amino acid transport system substrate-binding protein